MSSISAEKPQKETLDRTRGAGDKTFGSVNRALVLYWLFCLAVGLLLLRDEIFSWRIPSAWGQAPVLLVYAVAITLFNEWAYIQVARADGRAFSLSSTVLFTLINGVLEAFAFLAFFRLLEGASRWLLGPDWGVVNFIFGFLGFFIYSGLSHALFWARALPRHFTSDPRWQTLRKLLTPIQALIVLGWCLYFFATGDIWTIVALHLIIDVVLMAHVRPPVLMAVKPTTSA
jgi:hypothetical protein